MHRRSCTIEDEQLLQEEADSVFQSIIHESINIQGDHGIKHCDLVITNSKIDLEKLREGRAFYHRHFTACALAMAKTAFMTYPIQRINGVLNRQHNYSNPDFAMHRAFITWKYFNEWFNEGIENKLSETAQSVYKIRKLHIAVAKKLSSYPVPPTKTPRKDRMYVLDALHRDLADVPTPQYLSTIMTDTPSVMMSQFDMILSLGVFYFFLEVVDIRRAGIYSDEGYESYIYYVGIIGRYLGIEDRFNHALYPNPIVRKMVTRRLWDEVYTPCLKNITESDFKNLCYDFDNFGIVGTIMGGFVAPFQTIVKDTKNGRPATNLSSCVGRVDKIWIGIFDIAVSSFRVPPIRSFANMMAKAAHRAYCAWLERNQVPGVHGAVTISMA